MNVGELKVILDTYPDDCVVGLYNVDEPTRPFKEIEVRDAFFLGDIYIDNRDQIDALDLETAKKFLASGPRKRMIVFVTIE